MPRTGTATAQNYGRVPTDWALNQEQASNITDSGPTDRPPRYPVSFRRRFAADSLNGSKDDAKSRDLGSRRWAAVASAVVAASRSVVRIAARVDLTRPR